MILKKGLLVLTAGFLLWPAACTRHRVQVDPIRTEHVVEVKPMTINVNVRVKVDRALEDYFGDIDAAREDLETE
ncbi:MAG: hypothetical protein ACOC3W_01010 [Thermodesulfobacteriota bacterium]